MHRQFFANYTHTIRASYIGYITQAVVNNFAPLLFLIFSRDYGLSINQITLLTTLNFLTQLIMDLLSARFADCIGYRKCILIAHVLVSVGLVGLAVSPRICLSPYWGLLISVAIYAAGGGIIEALISPIVEACPTKEKETAMSLLHSFYCWGYMAVVLISTGFFALFGTRRWQILSCLWATIPAINVVYFSVVPIYQIVPEEKKLSWRELTRRKTFWILFALMVCAGASEQAINQWSSAFAESALHVSKTTGDLAGPCLFALCMGISRTAYGRFGSCLPLKRAIQICGFFCATGYMLAALTETPLLGLMGCALCGLTVGIFWPGTFSMAAVTIPCGGTAMYAMLALAGDLGCTVGPTIVGFAATDGCLKTGIFKATIFPLMILFGIAIMQSNNRLCVEGSRLKKHE